MCVRGRGGGAVYVGDLSWLKAQAKETRRTSRNSPISGPRAGLVPR